MPNPATGHSLTARYYSQNQVCKISSLSRSTIERLERTGGIPMPRRFGVRCKRYQVDLIDKWLNGENWRGEE
jgi:predicted DNA-binding transcriptional regulator AlpA